MPRVDKPTAATAAAGVESIVIRFAGDRTSNRATRRSAGLLWSRAALSPHRDIDRIAVGEAERATQMHFAEDLDLVGRISGLLRLKGEAAVPVRDNDRGEEVACLPATRFPVRADLGADT